MAIIIVVAVVLLICIFLFVNLQHKKIAETSPVISYNKLLEEHIPYYRNLDEANKARFEKLVASFIASVKIEGVGTEVDDTDRVLIASSAVIPIFGFPGWEYTNLTNIILYPDTFNNDFQFEGESRNILGMVGSGYMNGQMLLSRAALVKGFSGAAGKENAALHEFVHLIDKADGATDGIPENLMAHDYASPWLKMMHQEMHRIEAGKSDINPYALTNEAEFLAVTSEYFFEKPEQFQSKHPEIYELLSKVFMQSPAKK